MDIGEARRMGRALMDEHGLEDWRLVVDRAKKRAGVCRAAERTIGLSGPLTALHSPEQVRDTVLHEIAHALVGPRHGHGPRWQAMASSIGAAPERCLPQDAPSVPGAWVGTCPAGHTIDRHRRPSQVTSCRECSRSFSAQAIFTWTHHGVAAPMTPAYRRQLATLRATADRGGSGDLVSIGDRVRVLTPGRYQGFVGVVVKRGRTRFHVRGSGSLLTVPFDHVEAAQVPRVQEIWRSRGWLEG
ncbi:SprT-like domain-containing protein [Janibacter limosus]|jgi:predicted SprT family Zn-dependent metalloprotease|uniref:M48 family peptidase n=1 Tax=Janibacter limosus TaxID=53458 RepID=A0A4P6MZE1_9MICO|nr:SprT-like domain-containing protein [Janibacter limosus]QBF47707.1 M48 family peptidase [Janibacter limosus]